MSIRDEMLRDFEAEKSKEYDSKCGGRNEEEAELNCALWAATWALSKAAEVAESKCPYSGECEGYQSKPCKHCQTATEIRNLAKELEGRNEK